MLPVLTMENFASTSEDRVLEREVGMVIDNSMTVSTDRALNRGADVFTELLMRSLKEVEIRNGDIHGYCEKEEEIADLLSRLKVHGYAYSVRRSAYYRQSSSNVSKHEAGFYFSHLKGNVQIPFFGPAFSVESLVKRECSLGPKYRNKEECATADHLVDHVNPAKKRRLVMDTKKRGCPASFDIKCIRVFPEYTIKSVTDSSKKIVIEKLKRDFESTQAPKSYCRFYVTASQAIHHNHSTDCVKATGLIHPLIKNEIKNLVSEGSCSVRAIKLHLERFVATNFTGEDTPDRMNVMFYPTDTTIYNHMYRALFESKKSTIDQVALKHLIDQWGKESRDEKIFFRPYSDENEKVEPLLFCYQHKWQMDLLKKYGRVCLLDATYKTTKYDIPLFFLVVKTNVCYVVVGIFYIQVEKTTSIKEALEIFKIWNPDWSPVSWVTDFSEPEIRAIEGTFPLSMVYLCLFHRKNAWKRWLRKKDNLAVPEDSQKILNLWEEIAEAPSQEEFESTYEKLQTHEVFTANSNALDYFKNQWLPVHKRWVKAYEDKENFFANITTTNGVESLNKRLKHFFLKQSADKTLTGVIKVVVKYFLPSLFKIYCLKNSVVKSYSSSIPKFLHNRPEEFVRHVMERYTLVQSATTSVLEMGEGLFCVESFESKGSYYMVNFAKPSCMCYDFQRYKFPCKHFCFVFMHYPEWGFNKLNESYRSHPLICLDETHGIGSGNSCSADANPVLQISDYTMSEATTNQEGTNTTSPTSLSEVQEARVLATSSTFLPPAPVTSELATSSTSMTPAPITRELATSSTSLSREQEVRELARSPTSLSQEQEARELDTSPASLAEEQDMRELARQVINLSYNNRKGGAVRRTMLRLVECVKDLQSSNPKEDGLPLVATSDS